MPGRLFLTRSAAELEACFGVRGCPEIQPRRNMVPGQDLLVLGAKGWAQMRWGIIPVGRKNARGRPVIETLINARSETLFDKSAYEGVARAIVPADGWYEWTGERRKKTAWAITPRDGQALAFAAICDVWTAPGGQQLWQVATVTCPPNADVVDIHHRMGVLLRPQDYATWLSGTEDEARALMLPAIDGSLQVEEAQTVDWDAP